jgi:hypothetical protein
VLRSRSHVMDIAMVAVPPGVTASAARKPSAARQIRFLNRMAIAVMLALSAVLAFAPATVAQIVPSGPTVPPGPIVPSELGGPLADMFPGIENFFPGVGMPGPDINSHVSCAPADEQQHDCGQGSDAGEDGAGALDIDGESNSDSDSERGRASVRGAPRLVLSARPRRDRTQPLAFRLSGRLVPPMGLLGLAELFQTVGVDVRAEACNGRVTIAFETRGRTVARRRASVTSTCRFSSRITIDTRRSVGRARRLKATARFGGNRLLAPVRRSITLHIG